MAPCGADDHKCNIHKHSTRVRKTGIAHALVVLRCETHGSCWTLYPPGFAPFLRRPLSASAGWAATMFWAVLMGASQAPAWPRRRRSSDKPRSCWRTQTRHIQWAALLLGLLDDDVQPLLELGVPLDCAQRAKAFWAQATGFRARSRVLVCILVHPPPEGLARLLYPLGTRAGLWGQGWEVSGETLLAL